MQDGRWRRVVLTQRHRGTEESAEKPFRKASLLLGVAEAIGEQCFQRGDAECAEGTRRKPSKRFLFVSQCGCRLDGGRPRGRNQAREEGYERQDQRGGGEAEDVAGGDFRRA